MSDDRWWEESARNRERGHPTDPSDWWEGIRQAGGGPPPIDAPPNPNRVRLVRGEPEPVPEPL